MLPVLDIDAEGRAQAREASVEDLVRRPLPVTRASSIASLPPPRSARCFRRASAFTPFLTGYFGQNFEVLPFDWRALFFTALSLTVLTPTGMLLWLRRRGWW